jgi:hypothetical protein
MPVRRVLMLLLAFDELAEIDAGASTSGMTQQITT